MSRVREVLDAMRTLPLGTVNTVLRGCTPIILSPHPDDDVLGCGGLIMGAVEQGLSPVTIFVTDGSGSHPNSRSFPRAVLAELREKEARAASAILGVDPTRVHFLGIADTESPHHGPAFGKAVRAILAVSARYEPSFLLAPWAHDPHGDHLSAHKMAAQVAREGGFRHLSYPVWGWTLPGDQDLGDVSISGWRISIAGYLDRKLRALHEHASQLSDLIRDDPAGFRLEQSSLDQMISAHEVFLVNR